MTRASVAVVQARGAAQRARELVLESPQLRDIPGTASPRCFVVHGEVEGSCVRASWFGGGSSPGSKALPDRGQLLVRRGEQFAPERDGEIVDPTTSPLAPLFTRARARVRVRAVRFGPSHVRIGRHDFDNGQNEGPPPGELS